MYKMLTNKIDHIFTLFIFKQVLDIFLAKYEVQVLTIGSMQCVFLKSREMPCDTQVELKMRK